MFNMTPYEVYVFILCAIVFTVLTVLLSVMLGYMVSYYIKLIEYGAVDQKIKTEYLKKAERRNGFGVFLDRFVSIVLCLVMGTVFSLSVYLQVTETKVPDEIPSIKVVKSDSMARKHSANTYLAGIDNQLQTFDMIMTYQMPKEDDLELYDIVMYEKDGEFILHRIVKIEEPNSHHPNERWYVFQGDSLRYADDDPVLYSQMRGIYRGERMPFIGSFVMFMQSPAGYLCILLIVFGMIATPILEKKLEKAKMERLRIIKAGRGFRRLSRKDLLNLILSIGLKSIIFHSYGFMYWLMLRRYLDD